MRKLPGLNVRTWTLIELATRKLKTSSKMHPYTQSESERDSSADPKEGSSRITNSASGARNDGHG